jgi:hypothetical protein
MAVFWGVALTLVGHLHLRTASHITSAPSPLCKKH